MTGPSAYSGWKRGKGRAGGVVPLSRGAGAAARGRNAGRPAASRAPFFQPRVREPPDRRRGVRRPPPGVPLRSLPMPGRHGWRLGPHPPGVLRTQRRGLAPLPARGAGRCLLPAPPLQPASPAPTPRPMAWVSVSFPLATPPRGPKASPAQHLSPHHSITSSLCHCQTHSPDRPPGTGSGVPATFLTFIPLHLDPAVHTLRHRSCTPSWVVFPAEPSRTPMPTACETHFLTPLLHGRNPHHCKRMHAWSL